MSKRNFGNMGMNGNMQNLMKQAQAMQNKLKVQAEELAKKEFKAVSGGGMVEVTVSGKKEILNIKLNEEIVDKDDIEMLQDLIIAATNDALSKVDSENASSFGDLGLGGFGL